MLYEYLQERYEPGEPIFSIDIFGDSQENLRYHLKKLTDDGVICRFEAGIYFLPKENIFGKRIALSADTVIYHKYIMRKNKRIGYYSGYTLANCMGLSTQVPFKEEITSNMALASIRELKIKDRKYIIRRSLVEVTEENAAVLKFLDCLKNFEKCAEETPEVCGWILNDYARKYSITKEMIDRVIGNYPMKVYKAIYETGVKYVSA